MIQLGADLPQDPFERDEVEHEVVVVESSLDFGGHAVVMTVETLTLCTVVEDEVRRAEGKVVLLGDSGVGKSSIALRFCQRRFNQNHEVTIGAAFQQQIVGLPDGQIKLNIWDTGTTLNQQILPFSHATSKFLYVFC